MKVLTKLFKSIKWTLVSGSGIKLQMRLLHNFDSNFLGHASVQDLLEEFKQALKDLGESSMLQVSMDGPSVKLALYEELRKDPLRKIT